MAWLDILIIFLRVVLFIAAFAGIWLSSDLIIEGIDKFSQKTRLSRFASSFFILGLLTSLPETSVAINSIINKVPEIYVGNLIGGSFVIFLLLIPLLAIFGNGIFLNHKLDKRSLVMTLLIIITPTLFTIDGTVNRKEGFFMVIFYVLLFYFIEKKKGLVEQFDTIFSKENPVNYQDIGKIIVGCLIIFLSSRALIEQTIFFAKTLHLPLFFIGLLVISIGTNLPEISIGIKSVLSQKKDVAFGDYVGSAAANTLLFGLFTLVNGSFLIFDGFLITFLIFFFGLTVFFLFSRTKNDISRKEGIILLSFYLIFLMAQIGNLQV